MNRLTEVVLSLAIACILFFVGWLSINHGVHHDNWGTLILGYACIGGGIGILMSEVFS